MKQNQGSIRGQLLAALVLVVSIALGILAVGMVVMLRAEQNFRILAQDRIPAVALAGELAEVTSELAALAVQVVAEPELPSTRMSDALEDITSKIQAVMDSELWQDAPSRRTTRHDIQSSERDLRHSLTEFNHIRHTLAQLELEEARLASELRWAHIDVQDQVQGILSDLSFNLEAQLATLVNHSEARKRAHAERLLSQDWLLRDRVQQLGSDAATLTALLLQARAADNLDALEQTQTLSNDILDSLALAQLHHHTARVDLQLLNQALARLTQLATGESQVFAQQQQRLQSRQAAVTALQTAQKQLAHMQAALSALGRSERIHAQESADAAAATIRQGSWWLGLVTLLGAFATIAILALFVHRRLLKRIEVLSRDLRRIAQGDLTPLPSSKQSAYDLNQRDEIAAMQAAVDVFRMSVRERQHVIERLEHTQRELVQAGKMAALGQMSAAISHEINQPLAAIGHRLHNLRAAHPELGPRLDHLDALLARINRTIHHLRRIARRSEHYHHRVHLVEPVEAALALLAPRIEELGVTWHSDTLQEVYVAGDEVLLEQVLVNILANALDAIEANPAGASKGTIKLLLEGTDPVQLAIYDNGVGLDVDITHNLTDPFFTTKEADKGLGLGLSIAFNVMQDMGGHLDIEALEVGGAVVRLRLIRWEETRDKTCTSHAG